MRKRKDEDLPVCVYSNQKAGEGNVTGHGKSSEVVLESHSHKVIITETIIIVLAGIRLGVTASVQGDLSLSRLGLLVALVRSTLLAHLLVASSGEGTGDLLDLGTGQLLHKLAGEVLGPERVLGLLGVRGQQRHQNLGEAVELVLGGGLEEGHGGEVDGVCGVLGIGDDNGLGGALVALDIDTAEEILGVSKIGFLLGLAQAGAAIGLVFAVGLAEVLLLETVLLAVFFYTLGLGLLVGKGLGLSSGFGIGGLLGLLALDFGVLGGIP